MALPLLPSLLSRKQIQTRLPPSPSSGNLTAEGSTAIIPKEPRLCSVMDVPETFKRLIFSVLARKILNTDVDEKGITTPSFAVAIAYSVPKLILVPVTVPTRDFQLFPASEYTTTNCVSLRRAAIILEALTFSMTCLFVCPTTVPVSSIK